MFKNSFKNKFTAVILAFFIINFISPIFPAFSAEEIASPCRYPDYCKEYIGQDKFEKFNRRMFNFNAKLNKYALRPMHVVWASIMPKYGMDRIQNAYKNIEYPKRLVSTLLQKDLKAAKTETLRFLANTTIGLGGMYDPAKRFFKLEPQEEDIEQGLSKCKIKRGPFLVLPVINATTPRALAGRLLETGLDPTTYIASPVAALVKMGLFINRTSFMQPLSIYMERTYADPYDITRKLYGMENYIKNSNLDRKEILDAEAKIIEEVTVDSGAELMASTDTNASLIGEGEVLQIPEENTKDDKSEEKAKNETELLTVSGEPETENKSGNETDKIATNEVLKGGAYTDDTLKEAIQSTLEELKLLQLNLHPSATNINTDTLCKEINLLLLQFYTPQSAKV